MKKWTLLQKKSYTKYWTNLSLGLVIGLNLVACTPHDFTSIEIAQKCQDFHNPENDWYSSNYNFTIESQSIFSDNNKEVIDLNIDNKNQIFKYHNHFRNVGFEFSENNCIPLNDSSICDNYTWSKTFYPYITGIPCKFFDKGVALDSSFGGTIFNDIDVFVLHIKYEKETWDYFINKSNYKLEGFKFVLNEDNTKGEIVINKGQVEINGLIIPKKRIWYDLNKKVIGTDILIR